MSVLEENNVVLDDNSVEVKPCINRECSIPEIKIYFYRCYDEHEAPSSCNTTVNLSWLLHSEYVLGGEFHRRGKVVLSMKVCGRRNIRKHREIRGSDKYFTLDILLKFDSLDKMKITSSETKEKFKISGKGLITSLVFKAKVGPHKYKMARYAIRNVSKKDHLKIIRF